MNAESFSNVKPNEYKIEPTLDGEGLVLKRGAPPKWHPQGHARPYDGEWHVRCQDRIINLGEVEQEAVVAYMWEWRYYGGVEPMTWMEANP